MLKLFEFGGGCSECRVIKAQSSRTPFFCGLRNEEERIHGKAAIFISAGSVPREGDDLLVSVVCALIQAAQLDVAELVVSSRSGVLLLVDDAAIIEGDIPSRTKILGMERVQRNGFSRSL